MANLFQNKPKNKKVETSVGTFYVKPLPMSMLGWAGKLSNPDINPTEQALAFATILKSVAVDEDGNKFDDIENTPPAELSDMFPAEDLMQFIQVILPAPEDNSGNVS